MIILSELSRPWNLDMDRYRFRSTWKFGSEDRQDQRLDSPVHREIVEPGCRQGSRSATEIRPTSRPSMTTGTWSRDL